MGTLQGGGQCSSLFVFAGGTLAHASTCRCLFLRHAFSSFRHIQFDLKIVFHRTPPCLFLDGVMLGHLRSLVEENGLFVSAVVSIKRHPANSRQVALPHLHANSTGLPGFVRILRISPRLPSLAPHHLSRSKCEGVLLFPHSSRLRFPTNRTVV